MNNREFAETNNEFRRLCKMVDINPTKRQASKYRNKRGKAYKEEK